MNQSKDDDPVAGEPSGVIFILAPSLERVGEIFLIYCGKLTYHNNRSVYKIIRMWKTFGTCPKPAFKNPHKNPHPIPTNTVKYGALLPLLVNDANNKKPPKSLEFQRFQRFYFGRSDGIRTHDPLTPS